MLIIIELLLLMSQMEKVNNLNLDGVKVSK